MVGAIWVLYRNEGGDFAEAVALKNDEGQHLCMFSTDRSVVTDQICTEPFAHDWDGDGDLDLVIGNFKGGFMLATNVGTKTEPAFKGLPTWLEDKDGNPLVLTGGNHGAPFLVDWDGDGDIDLLSGSGYGGVQIAENVATASETGPAPAPSFAAFRPLIVPPPRAPSGLQPHDAPVAMGTSWRIWVADYNADGKLDILVGDRLSRSLVREGVSLEEATLKQAEWQTKAAEMAQKSRELRQRIMEMQAAPPVRPTADSDGDGEPEGDESDSEESEDSETEEGDAEPEEPAEPTIEDLMAELTALSTAQRAHHATRSAFAISQSTGHVWLYLAK